MTMNSLMGFFDCLPFRRLFFGNNTGTDDDGRDVDNSPAPSDGYYPGSSPMRIETSPASGSPSRPDRLPKVHRLGRSPPYGERFYDYRRPVRRRDHSNRRTRQNERLSQRRNRRSSPARSVSSIFDDSCHSSAGDAPRRGDYSQHAAPEASTHSIDGRYMHVIDALFHRPGAPRVNEVEWDDFIRVMAHIGFSIEPGNGASHSFRVASRSAIFPVHSLGEVITVHRPHPRTALSFIQMRETGRRLTRAFGWSADTFTSK